MGWEAKLEWDSRTLFRGVKEEGRRGEWKGRREAPLKKKRKV